MDRRGLAYDQASILSYAVHARWIGMLIQHKHRIPPGRYDPVTWHQLHTADEELFLLAAQAARSGIRPDATGTKPLDAIFDRLMVDPRVTFFLMPLPTVSGHGQRNNPADAGGAPAKRQKTESSNANSHQQGGSSSKKGNSKGKKAKKQDKKRVLPGGLFTQTRNGKPICPDFNSPGGCQAGTSNNGLASCPKGLHLCWAEKCRDRATHGFPGHTAASG